MKNSRLVKVMLAGALVVGVVLALAVLLTACGSSPQATTTTAAVTSTTAAATPTTAVGTAASTVGTGLSKDDVLAFVNKAKAYIDANGKEAAIKEFMNTSGDFYPNGGELYIFAYDLTKDGMCLCLPPTPEKVGTSLWDLKDDTGNYFIRDFYNIAKTKGSGWSVYRYYNPAENNAVQDKTSYILKIDDTWLIGAGAYGVTG